MNLQEQAVALTTQHPWVKFQWETSQDNFDVWSFRYLVACIAVGGASEESVFKMAPVLFNKYPTVNDLADLSQINSVAQILVDSDVRFHENKAKYIVKTAIILSKLYNGKVPNNRAQLEELPGVGRHVASVMLATVFDQNEFAVDLHVRRIMERWGYTGSDLALEQLVRENVEPKLWGHFSRAFVDFGQQRCGFVARCHAWGGCPIADCGSRSVAKKPKTAAAIAKAALPKVPDFEGYRIEQNAKGDWEFQSPGSDKVCTVTANKKCNCTGFRYRSTCKHVVRIFG